MLDIAHRIKELCEKQNVNSMYELSKLSGVPQSTLATIMSGSSPRCDTLGKICAGLKTTMAEFFTEENPELFNIAETIKNLSDSTGKVNDLFIKKVKSMPNASDYVGAELENLRDSLIEEYGPDDEDVKQLNTIIAGSFEAQVEALSKICDDVRVEENGTITFIAKTNQQPEVNKHVNMYFNLEVKDREMVNKFIEFLRNQK